MVYRIYVEKKPGFDVEAQGLKNELVSLLGIQSLSGLRLLNRYDVEGIDEALFNQCATTVFSEPPVDNTYAELPEFEGISFAVEYLPGQFDQRADSAAACIQLISQGEHHFTYALLPHTGDFIAGRTVQEASDLNWPMHSVAGSVKLPFAGSFVGFDKECVELDAVKKTEDGKYIAVRFHDFTGGTNKLTVTPGFAWKRYCECDLRERP